MPPSPQPTEPPQVGLFLQLNGGPDVPAVYQNTLRLICAAEELGFHSARVTQHHFGERYGWLPAPLPFLAAAGQWARRIRLGTVVVTIPLEQPLRLAEDAAVTDLLLDGRLELGVGSGLNADVFAIFGVDPERKRALTAEGLDLLRRALRGEPLDGRGARLQPPAPGLAGRLWLAVMSEEGARSAARDGLGLLLGRVEHGGGSPVANQTRTARIYRAALGPRAAQARIAAGRTLYPAADRATALRELAEVMRPQLEAQARAGFLPGGATLEEALARLHIIHGHPEEIAQMLLAEQAAIGWTELLVQVDPGDTPPGRALRALEVVAREIVPALAAAVPVPA